MKRSNFLTSQRTFERRVKARLEQIQAMETGTISSNDDEVRIEDCESECEDECESECEDECEDPDDYCDDQHDNQEFSESLEIQLLRWAITRKISLSALTELLKMLKPYVLEDLPTDARTLLKTPASVEIEDSLNGKFWQSGFKNNLLLLLKHTKCPKTLKLMVSIDGVKPYKS